ENRTSGVATLLKRHVEIADGRATFTYVGKRSIRQRQIVANRSLARLVARHLESPGARLFRYRDGRQWRDLTARDVNGYLRDRLGVPFSAKDFRTWGGTLRAATVLAELGAPQSETEAKRNVATAMRLVAAELSRVVRPSPRRGALRRRRGDDPLALPLSLDGGRVRAFAGGARPHPLPRPAFSRAEAPNTSR